MHTSIQDVPTSWSDPSRRSGSSLLRRSDVREAFLFCSFSLQSLLCALVQLSLECLLRLGCVVSSCRAQCWVTTADGIFCGGRKLRDLPVCAWTARGRSAHDVKSSSAVMNELKTRRSVPGQIDGLDDDRRPLVTLTTPRHHGTSELELLHLQRGEVTGGSRFGRAAGDHNTTHMYNCICLGLEQHHCYRELIISRHLDMLE